MGVYDGGYLTTSQTSTQVNRTPLDMGGDPLSSSPPLPNAQPYVMPLGVTIYTFAINRTLSTDITRYYVFWY